MKRFAPIKSAGEWEIAGMPGTPRATSRRKEIRDWPREKEREDEKRGASERLSLST